MKSYVILFELQKPVYLPV